MAAALAPSFLRECRQKFAGVVHLFLAGEIGHPAKPGSLTVSWSVFLLLYRVAVL